MMVMVSPVMAMDDHDVPSYDTVPPPPAYDDIFDHDGNEHMDHDDADASAAPSPLLPLNNVTIWSLYNANPRVV